MLRFFKNDDHPIPSQSISIGDLIQFSYSIINQFFSAEEAGAITAQYNNFFNSENKSLLLQIQHRL